MRLVRLVLAGVGLLLAACVGLIGIGLLLPDPPADALPTATVAITRQVAGIAPAVPATAMPTPTVTPMPPSPTATSVPVVPTTTAMPTATSIASPTPMISPAERAYAAKVMVQADELAVSLRQFSQLAAAPRPLEADWRRELVGVLALWRVTDADARAMAPPPRFRAFHARYLASLAELSAAADDVAWAIDHAGSSAGVARMEQAGVRIQRANWLLDAAMQLFPRVAP